MCFSISREGRLSSARLRYWITNTLVHSPYIQLSIWNRPSSQQFKLISIIIIRKLICRLRQRQSSAVILQANWRGMSVGRAGVDAASRPSLQLRGVESQRRGKSFAGRGSRQTSDRSRAFSMGSLFGRNYEAGCEVGFLAMLYATWLTWPIGHEPPTIDSLLSGFCRGIKFGIRVKVWV